MRMKRMVFVLIIYFTLVGCTSRSQLKRKSAEQPFNGGAGEIVLQTGEIISTEKILFSDTAVILSGKIKQRGSDPVLRNGREPIVLAYNRISEVRLKQESDAAPIAFAAGTAFGTLVMPYLIFIPLLMIGGLGF